MYHQHHQHIQRVVPQSAPRRHTHTHTHTPRRHARVGGSQIRDEKRPQKRPQKRSTHMKRDPWQRPRGRDAHHLIQLVINLKETYKTDPHKCKVTYQRDQHIWKETTKYGKRPLNQTTKARCASCNSTCHRTASRSSPCEIWRLTNPRCCVSEREWPLWIMGSLV